jgi:hypothetical protein
VGRVEDDLEQRAGFGVALLQHERAEALAYSALVRRLGALAAPQAELGSPHQPIWQVPPTRIHPAAAATTNHVE